jgi:type IV secretory pathway VirB3-like protein
MIRSRVYQGLIKKPLFLGGEFIPILFNAMAGFIVLLLFRNILSAIVTVIVLVVNHSIINYINAGEPQFFEMFKIFLFQKKYYPARSNIFSVHGKKWRRN